MIGQHKNQKKENDYSYLRRNGPSGKREVVPLSSLPLERSVVLSSQIALFAAERELRYRAITT